MALTSDAHAAKLVSENKPLLLSQGPSSNVALGLLPFPQGSPRFQAEWVEGEMALLGDSTVISSADFPRHLPVSGQRTAGGRHRLDHRPSRLSMICEPELGLI